jgi:hypothetical protein
MGFNGKERDLGKSWTTINCRDSGLVQMAETGSEFVPASFKAVP